MKAVALSFVFLLLPVAASGQVYKWTDKQGVTHYSQQPPEDSSFEERRVKARDAKSQETAAKGPTGAELRKQSCDMAKKNLEILKSTKQVYIQPPPKAEATDASTAKTTGGQAAPKPEPPTILNAEQRAAELKNAEAQVQLFCES